MARADRFVYHLIAADFRGTVLYPLNGLAATHPDVYEREVRKYDGRESVIRYRVPHLDAAWADTVNLSTLDPRLLLAERRRRGISDSQLMARRLVAIPIRHLAHHRLVRYSGATRWINSSPGEDVPLEPPAHEFEPVDPIGYRETTEIPVTHLEYLGEQAASGRRALAFVHVPHVLALGPIDIATLEAVEMS